MINLPNFCKIFKIEYNISIWFYAKIKNEPEL